MDSVADNSPFCNARAGDPHPDRADGHHRRPYSPLAQMTSRISSQPVDLLTMRARARGS